MADITLDDYEDQVLRGKSKQQKKQKHRESNESNDEHVALEDQEDGAFDDEAIKLKIFVEGGEKLVLNSSSDEIL